MSTTELEGLGEEPIGVERHGQHFAIYSPDQLHRYVLTREWDAATKLVVIGLNPSTATADTDDPTIRRCMGYAKRWGYGGLVMLNLFAWRATEPRDLKRADRMGSNIIGPLNDRILDLYATPSRSILCAWGGNGAYQRRGYDVMVRLAARYAALQCLGRTTGGEPVHPLYQRADLLPVGYP